MTELLKARLAHLLRPEQLGELRRLRRGVEKESLRVSNDGRLARTPHAESLGSALTHPYLTTDYSEALLEFISPVHAGIDETMSFLQQLHRYTLENIGEEQLWASSMPCQLQGDASIPIARYGDSNPGRMKYIYRVGLAHRYGRTMQAIAGIHYNFSLPGSVWQAVQQLSGNNDDKKSFESASYMGLVRNFRRHAWLLMYGFGASPALDASFVEGMDHNLDQLSPDTFYLPYATSLRMGDLGYTDNKAQASLNICYNTLDEYVGSLKQAMKTPWPEYEAIGVKEGDEYRQLNANILQIENEYYSTIRPKRVVASGEKPVDALSSRGVEYIEVRCLDINPFMPLGLDEQQIAFMDTFLLYCALSDSPAIESDECGRISCNFNRVVTEGRRPGLQLQGHNGPVSLQQLGSELLEQMQPVARLLDEAWESSVYTQALGMMQDRLLDPQKTPSAQVMEGIHKAGNSFVRFNLELSARHADTLQTVELDDARRDYFRELVVQSWKDQLGIEADSDCSFEEYLERYFIDVS
ncbi:glutamate--cysteine ligase [Endozoicomonadaceae bacterium StTr2]